MGSLGIDLGTASLRVATLAGATPVLLADAEGATAIPAVVSFDGATSLVGHAAEAHAEVAPGAAFRGIKWFLGRAADDPALAAAPPHVAARLVADPQGGGVLLRVAGQTRAPETVAAPLFAHVAELVERAGGRAEPVVMTAPAWLPAAAREALILSALSAGLGVERVVADAAAIALGLPTAQQEGKQLVAIADVGAGGVSVSILRIRRRELTVLASVGDARAGGDQVDAALSALALAPGGPLARGRDEKVAARVQVAAEKLKRELGSAPKAGAVLPFLPGAPGVTLSREDLGLALAGLFEAIEQVVAEALARSGLSAKRLDAVYATGGMTRAAAVRSRLASALDRPPIFLYGAGGTAFGAAKLAGMRAGELPKVVVIDEGVTSAPAPRPIGVPPFSTAPRVLERASGPRSSQPSTPPGAWSPREATPGRGDRLAALAGSPSSWDARAPSLLSGMRPQPAPDRAVERGSEGAAPSGGRATVRAVAARPARQRSSHPTSGERPRTQPPRAAAALQQEDAPGRVERLRAASGPHAPVPALRGGAVATSTGTSSGSWAAFGFEKTGAVERRRPAVEPDARPGSLPSFDLRGGPFVGLASARAVLGLRLAGTLEPSDVSPIALPVLLVRMLVSTEVRGLLTLEHAGRTAALYLLGGRAHVTEPERVAAIHAFLWREGTFTFEPGRVAPGARASLSLTRLTIDGLRLLSRSFSAKELEDALGDRLELAPVLRSSAWRVIGHFGLTSDESRHLENGLDGRVTAKTLAPGGIGRHASLVLLVVLSLFGAVDWLPPKAG